MKAMKMVTAALALLLSGCAARQVESGLTQQDAQEIAVLLRDHGITTRIQPEAKETGKKGESWEVLVRGGSDRAVDAWKILRENGLPREKVRGLDEVYSSAGMIPTATEEKARLLVGLSGELSRTLKSIAGVVDARVHVAVPESNPLLEKAQQTPTTASVLVKHSGNQPPLKAEEIKNLVAKGIEGLAVENVSVVFKQVQVRSADRNPLEILMDSSLTFALALLSCFTGIGALVMLGRFRLAKAKADDLEKRIAALSPQSLEPAGRV